MSSSKDPLSVSKSSARASSSPTVSFMLACGPTPSPNATPQTHLSLSGGSKHRSGGGSSGRISVTPSEKSLMLLPPSQSIKESLTSLASSTAAQLEGVWDEVGYDPEERASQLVELLSEFRRLCEQKIAEERGVAVTFRQTIADSKEEMRTTSAALKTPVDPQLLRDDTGQSLTDELATLEATLEGLRAAASAASADLAECRDKISEAHAALGTEMERAWEDISSDLTQARREEFHDMVEEMNEAVLTRTSAVVHLLQDCQSLMKELRIDEENGSDLDRQIAGSLVKSEEGGVTIVSKTRSENCTGISSKALDDITNRVAELSGEKRRRKIRLGEMGEEIQTLWEKLHVSADEQRSFTENIQGLGMDTIEKGEEELKRLHALKAQMIGNLIAEARDNISRLWDETNANEQQRKSFDGAGVTDESLFTDDLLAEHEDYIRVLEGRLDQMRPILKIINLREDIIRERTEYDELQKDPDRLKQRGAALTRQLMMEEKMANRIKKLPKYTHSLEEKLREWQRTNGEQFLYQGEPYLDVMKRQEEDWKKHKDHEKQATLIRRQEEMAMDKEKANGTHFKPLAGKKKGRTGTHSHKSPGDRAPSRGHAARASASTRPLADAKNRENTRAPSRARTNNGKVVSAGTRGSSTSTNRSVSVSRRATESLSRHS